MHKKVERQQAGVNACQYSVSKVNYAFGPGQAHCHINHYDDCLTTAQFPFTRRPGTRTHLDDIMIAGLQGGRGQPGSQTEPVAFEAKLQHILY